MALYRSVSQSVVSSLHQDRIETPPSTSTKGHPGAGKYTSPHTPSPYRTRSDNRTTMSTCRFIKNLFTCAAPVWADQATLAALQSAADNGLRISNDRDYRDGVLGADKAIALALERLELDGIMPYDMNTLFDKASEAGIPTGLDLDEEIQELFSLKHMGNPAYLHVNIAHLLEVLRFMATVVQQHMGHKPVFQVGILTLSVHNTSKTFSAQLFAAEEGIATGTVWLYRWCVYQAGGHYEEYWRPFVRNVDQVGRNTVFDGQTMATTKQPIQPAVAANTSSRKRPLETDGATGLPGAYQIPTNTAPQAEPQAKRRRNNRFHAFDHWAFTDDQLFAGDHYLIQGDCIIRLAHSHNNQDIMNRINAHHPGAISSVNVITKRLTHAIGYAADTTGKTTTQIRQEIANAKAANGVEHKAKIETGTYANRGAPPGAGSLGGM